MPRKIECSRVGFVLSALLAMARPAIGDVALPTDCEQDVLSRDAERVACLRGSPRELWMHDLHAGASRLLLVERQSDSPRRSLVGINGLRFSADGRQLYFLSEAWVTSNALHRVDILSGRVVHLGAANDFLLIEDGGDAGRLLVQRHVYKPGGGSEEIWFLATGKGRSVRRIGDDAARDSYLASRGR